MKVLSFEITMPSVGSWNGVWTGAKNAHFAFKKCYRKEDFEQVKHLIDRYFDYNFGDGWCAGIKVRLTDVKTMRKIQKFNNGFMGYDWMIDSILHKGIIETPN